MDRTPRTNALATLLVVLIGLPLCAFFAYWSWWAFVSRDTTPRGVLASVRDWPGPIQDLYGALVDAGVDTETFEVFLLRGQPAETLSTVVCRLNVDDAGWDAIQQKLELLPTAASEIEFLRESIVTLADASWWPHSSAQAEYFASKRSLAGDEGDLYLAARDATARRAFVHYEFNF